MGFKVFFLTKEDCYRFIMQSLCISLNYFLWQKKLFTIWLSFSYPASLTLVSLSSHTFGHTQSAQLNFGLHKCYFCCLTFPLHPNLFFSPRKPTYPSGPISVTTSDQTRHFHTEFSSTLIISLTIAYLSVLSLAEEISKRRGIF